MLKASLTHSSTGVTTVHYTSSHTASAEIAPLLSRSRSVSTILCQRTSSASCFPSSFTLHCLNPPLHLASTVNTMAVHVTDYMDFNRGKMCLTEMTVLAGHEHTQSYPLNIPLKIKHGFIIVQVWTPVLQQIPWFLLLSLL